MLSSFEVLLFMIITVLVFAAIGIGYSRGKVGAMDDFFTARGSTGTKILSATLMASFMGVFLLFTPPEAGFLGGLPAIIGYALGVASLYFAFMLLSPKIKGYLPMGSTLTDYAWKRYGRKMHGLTVTLSLFYMLVHLVAELTAISQVAYQLAEIPMLYTALLIGVGTMIYTAYGGLRASMFTDMLQMLLVVILLLGVTLGILFYGGGVEAVINRINTNSPQLMSLGNWSGIQYGLTLFIGVFASNLFHQGYWQRIYAGKDNGILKKSLKFSIVLVLPVMLLTGFIGIVAAGFNAAENPSVALFNLAHGLFPKEFMIVLFGLALMLVMSTVDTLLNAVVATLTIDSQKIIKGIKKENILPMARLITVLLMIPLSFIAARGYSVLYLFFVADLVCAGVFIPLFLGLYSSHLTEKAALGAALLGVASGIPFFINNQLLLSFTIPVVVSGSICFIAIQYEKSRKKSAIS